MGVYGGMGPGGPMGPMMGGGRGGPYQPGPYPMVGCFPAYKVYFTYCNLQHLEDFVCVSHEM